MRRVAIALIGLALGAAFYMLLIDTADPPELYVACGVALLAGALFEISREQGFADASIRPGWLLGSWRVLLSIPRQIALVSREAIAQLVSRKATRGAFRAVPFDGGAERRRDAGRRGLAEALGSLAPNTIVIGVDRGRNLLLVHQLHREGDRDELDVLRLG